MENQLQTIDCLITLQSAYPRLDLGPQTILVYQQALADIEPRLLQAAVLKHISTSKWLPAIAELRQAATEIILQSEGHLSAPEAWGEVQREVRAVGHWGEPKLQPAVLQAVAAIGGWRHICFSENVTADRARFLEAYTLLRKREMVRLQQIPAVTEVQDVLAEGRETDNN